VLTLGELGWQAGGAYVPFAEATNMRVQFAAYVHRPCYLYIHAIHWLHPVRYVDSHQAAIQEAHNLALNNNQLPNLLDAKHAVSESCQCPGCYECQPQLACDS